MHYIQYTSINSTQWKGEKGAVELLNLMSVCGSVEGGELFDRIVDESAPLTEVDAMVFVKQICEGVSYMHQMYVLHLDLKVSMVDSICIVSNQILSPTTNCHKLQTHFNHHLKHCMVTHHESKRHSCMCRCHEK